MEILGKNVQRLSEEPVSKQGVGGNLPHMSAQKHSSLSEHLKYQQTVHPTHPFAVGVGAEAGNVCRMPLMVGHNLKTQLQQKQL